MADRASACCACSFGPLRATVRQRRTQRKKAAQAAFSVCGREDAAEIDAPVPVLPIPHCTALDGQDFNACCTSSAPCCCNSWLHARTAGKRLVPCAGKQLVPCIQLFTHTTFYHKRKKTAHSADHKLVALILNNVR